jgi:hypothetical protein
MEEPRNTAINHSGGKTPVRWRLAPVKNIDPMPVTDAPAVRWKNSEILSSERMPCSKSKRLDLK